MPSKPNPRHTRPFTESWLLLTGSALVLLLFFLKLYAVLTPRLLESDTDLAAHKAIVLAPGIDKNRLQHILAAGNYFPDPRDLQLVTDSLAAGLNAHGAPANLGELNKKKWLIAVPTAWNPAGMGADFRERLLASRQRLGFDSVVYNRELTRPPAYGSSVSVGKGKLSIDGKLTYEGNPAAGVLVELREHIAGEDEQPLPHYSRTDGEGRFRFNGLSVDSGYSVLPLKPGFEFGARQGTASLTEDRSLVFRMQPHRMRLIGSIAFSQLKEDNVLLVRDPDTFSRNYWIILWTTLGAFFLVQLYLQVRKRLVDPFLLPILLLLSGLSLLMLLCIQHPLTDTFLSFQTLQGLLAGLLGFTLLAGTKPGKLYTRWWYDALFNFRQREVFGLKGFTWLVAALLLAIITLLFGTGPEGSGVKVNLQVAGILFQPSEITKYLLLIFMAGFFAANESHLRHISDSRNRFLLAFLLMAGVALLLALYLMMGDMGPALVVCFSFLVFYGIARGNLLLMLGAAVLYGTLLFFLPGITATAIAFVTVVLALVFTGAARSATWYGRIAVLTEAPVLILLVMAAFRFGDRLPGIGSRLADRKAMWLQPWNNDVYGGDHLAHGYWTLSAGGWKGQGIGKGFPNTMPAAHTDMILPSIGEEMGWIGLFMVFCLLAILIHRILLQARRAGQSFSFYLCAGIAVATGVQILLMAGGSIGLLPLTGLAVPFLSYGKISLIINCCALGIVAGISAQPAAAMQQEHISRQYDGVLSAAITGMLAGFAVVLVKLFFIQVKDRDAYLVQQSRVVNRNGLPIYSYNPRIDKLADFIAAGEILDRKGLPVATSRVEVLTKNRDSLLAAGLDPLRFQAVLQSRKKRRYPFGADVFYWTGDYNTRLFWAQQNGYFAEARHLSALRGFETNPVKHEQLAMEYRPDRFTKPVEKAVELVRYDYSALTEALKNGIDSSNAAIRKIIDAPRNIQLTVDAGLQKEIQDSLARSAFNGKRISVVVLDAASGDLLASALNPLPDLQRPELLELPDRERRHLAFPVTERDLGMTYATQPGSAVKILTATAALNKLGMEAARRQYRDIARTEIFRDNAREQEPYVPLVPFVDMREAIVHSSNIFFIRMANEYDLEEEMAKLYLGTGMRINQLGGFDYTPPLDGERTAAALANWRATTLNHDRRLFNNRANFGHKKRYLSDFSGLAWGQGTLTATPASMARMASAIALNGSLPPTRYTLQVAGRPSPVEAPVRLANDSGYAGLLRRFMIEQSNPGGRAKIKGLKVAGKTGTPERIVKGEKTADGWYVFFAPVPGKASATVTCIRIEEGLSSANAVTLGNTVAGILQKRNYVESYQ